jgi:hypothetical protein
MLPRFAFVCLVLELQVITGFHSQSAWILKSPMRDIRPCESRCLMSRNCGQNTETTRDVSPITRRDLMLNAATLGSLLLAPQNVYADMTLETFKRAYYRYVPRIEAGIKVSTSDYVDHVYFICVCCRA